MKPYRFGGVRVWSDKERAYVRVDIDATIDWDRVALKLATSALRNTTGKTGLLEGAIKAKVVKVTKAA